MELLRISKASNPGQLGVGVIKKVMSCIEKLVQTRI